MTALPCAASLSPILPARTGFGTALRMGMLAVVLASTADLMMLVIPVTVSMSPQASLPGRADGPAGVEICQSGGRLNQAFDFLKSH